MEIELYRIKIRDIRDGYTRNDETGEVYTNILKTDANKLKNNAQLNIRPAYQREFVYKDKKRDEVIRTVQKGFPLNVMYWVQNDDGTFEILDGQQRTISILEYIKKDGTSFSLNEMYFHSLSPEKQNQILDYELMIYICKGTYQDKLDWFKVINIAGEQLTDQELRNAMFVGPWLSDAKKHFSKMGCAATQLGKDYVKGNPINQELLAKALSWIVDAHKERYSSIEEYMSQHQYDKDCNELWIYYQEIISWIKRTFIKLRKQMLDVDWGIVYNKYHKNFYNSNDLETRISELMKDDDVTNKKGIYEYVLSGNEKYLNIRAFTETQKAEAYEKCQGICAKCQKQCQLDEMEADHITPWSQGGKTEPNNLQMLCSNCNRTKSNK